MAKSEKEITVLREETNEPLFRLTIPAGGQEIDRGHFPYELVWAKEADKITIDFRHI